MRLQYALALALVCGLWRMRRSEFWIAVVCLVSVLALGPLRAVDIDTTGAATLQQVIGMLAKRNITVAVSRADRSFRSWLERYELMTLFDERRFYPTNRHAAEAFREDLARVGART